ncbi:MAG: hypothetical protein KIT11_01470 [Fimbriimonadaceae bacterium]|nr:hypothetical protein [Fimbriimonadaceae bacterium]QYK54960.1 MAG: hypothetical protein KF733_08065 [Fimbriimonadaceae bacterium]
METRLNEATVSTQNEPTLTLMGDGSFVAAWASRRQNVGASAVMTRSFDRLGRPLGPEAFSSEVRNRAHIEPSLAKIAGKAVPLYVSLFREGEQTSIFAGDSRVNSVAKGAKSDAVSATSADGRTVVAWLQEVGHAKPRVMVRVFDALGTPVGDAVPLASPEAGSDSNPTVAVDARGPVVVFNRTEGNEAKGVFAQRLNWAGAPVGAAVQIADSRALEASVVATRDGLVAVWSRSKNDGEFDVLFQRFDSDFAPVGEPKTVEAQSGSQNAASVAALESGRFAVAWNLRSGAERDVYARLFAQDGTPESKTFRVNGRAEGDQAMTEVRSVQRIAYTEDGLTVVWAGDGGLGDGSGVHATRVIRADALSDVEIAKIEGAQNSTLLAMRKDEGGHEQNQLKFVRVVQEDTTGPHEPPIDRPDLAVNEWGSVNVSATGGFTAIGQTSFTPPDPDVAIGPDHIVAVVNDGIAFFNKDGTKTYEANMRFTNGFWGQLSAIDNFIYDPEAFYDYSTGRFWVMATQGTGSRAWVLVAVSDDSDPNGTWYKYQFETSSQSGGFYDSPNFGVDENVLYISGYGVNRGNFPVYTFDKAPFLAGQNPTVQRSVLMPTNDLSAGQPKVIDGNEPAYYFVDAFSNGSTITVRALRDPLGTPNFTSFNVTVPNYTSPESPPQQGTTSRPNTFNARLWNTKYRNGSIWTSHHQGSSRVLARWYQIRLNGWPTSGQNPNLVQSGNIDLGSTIRTFFCSIGIDPAGNAAMAYARSSPTEFISSAFSTRKPGDPLGTMPTSDIAKTSTGPYNGGRWGDYSGLESDPAYPGLFWSHAEYAEGANWFTWLQPFRATTVVVPTGFRLFRGSLTSGNLAGLYTNDGNALAVRNGPRLNNSEPAISVVFSSRSWVASPSSFTLNLRTKVSTAGLTQVVELFDWQANAWVEVDRRAASVAYGDLSVNPANPSRFVKPGKGEVEARVSYLTLGPVATSNYTADFDVAAWDIN